MELTIIFILILCSAFFSASETALTGANRIRLKSMEENGSKGARLALKLIEKYDKVLTTILIGNNIVNIAVTAIATMFAVSLLGEDRGPLAATVVLTLLLLIFGEVLPKSIANDHSEGMSVGISGIITVLTYIFTPLSAFFLLLKKLASKLFGGKKKEVTVTEQELIKIIDEIEDEGVLEEQESDLVKSALVFDETVVDEIITHRMDVLGVEVNDDIEKVRDIFMNCSFSRLPVYEGSLDKIIGFINQKDFFTAYIAKKDDFLISDIVQEISYFPHLMKISDILRTMQREKIHMAVVLDQYGGTLGIVTLEDILEQLVGEIWDENDEVVSPLTYISENVFRINGDVSLNAFRRYWHNKTEQTLNIDSNARTVGGWVMELFGKIPSVSDTVKTEDFLITVTKTEERRIVQLRFQIISEEKDLN
ncbi:MAG: HlyC/CorC family transporter [Eubacterium sp.]|nr:HlyC/CorC family transporter [Eubacterium sp.]